MTEKKEPASPKGGPAIKLALTREEAIRLTHLTMDAVKARYCVTVYQEFFSLPDDDRTLYDVFKYVLQGLSYYRTQDQADKERHVAFGEIIKHIPDVVATLEEALKGNKPSVKLSQEEQEKILRALQEQAERQEQVTKDDDPEEKNPEEKK